MAHTLTVWYTLEQSALRTPRISHTDDQADFEVTQHCLPRLATSNRHPSEDGGEIVPHASRPALTRLKREHLAPRDQAVYYRIRVRQVRSQALKLPNLAATVCQRVVSRALFGLVLSGLLLGRASGEELVLYGAGSLREVMT